MPIGSDLPIAAVGTGVRLIVRLTPKSAGDAVCGIGELPDGRPCLLARVAAPPGDGLANAALIKLLAKTFRVPKTSLDIVSGRTDRTKVVGVSGDPAALQDAIAARIAALGNKA